MVINVARKLQSLYIVCIIEQIRFQPASKNRQRCGGSDVLGKLVPDRGGHDNESAVINGSNITRNRGVVMVACPTLNL